MMKKYFSSGFFLKFKRKLSAFQRTQPELLGVSERGSGAKRDIFCKYFGIAAKKVALQKGSAPIQKKYCYI